MNVHVPQARNQELTSALNYLGILGNSDRSACSDLANAVADDDDGTIRLSLAVNYVDYGHVSDYERDTVLTQKWER